MFQKMKFSVKMYSDEVIESPGKERAFHMSIHILGEACPHTALRVCASETKRWNLQLCSSHVSPPAQRHCPWMTAPVYAGQTARMQGAGHRALLLSTLGPPRHTSHSLQGPQALPLLRAAPLFPFPSLPMPLRLL